MREKRFHVQGHPHHLRNTTRHSLPSPSLNFLFTSPFPPPKAMTLLPTPGLELATSTGGSGGVAHVFQTFGMVTFANGFVKGKSIESVSPCCCCCCCVLVVAAVDELGAAAGEAAKEGTENVGTEKLEGMPAFLRAILVESLANMVALRLLSGVSVRPSRLRADASIRKCLSTQNNSCNNRFSLTPYSESNTRSFRG